jgi:hypothetical protein
LIKDRDALTMFEVQRLFDDDNRRDRQCFLRVDKEVKCFADLLFSSRPPGGP